MQKPRTNSIRTLILSSLTLTQNLRLNVKDYYNKKQRYTYFFMNHPWHIKKSKEGLKKHKEGLQTEKNLKRSQI
jgi:hypothetical protein